MTFTKRLAVLCLFMVGLAGALQAQVTITYEEGFASQVLQFNPGNNQVPGPLSNILGNNQSTFLNLGQGGTVVVEFDSPNTVSGAQFTTSGDSQPDLCVFEAGYLDCFYVCISPADDPTRNALIDLGFPINIGDFFDLGVIHCGSLVEIDLDEFFPGFDLGELRFDQLMIIDAEGPPNGSEITVVNAKYIPILMEPQTAQLCFPEYANDLIDFTTGEAQNGSTPMNALGANGLTNFQLGGGGSLTVSFQSPVSNSGNTLPDLSIDEVGNAECYTVRVRPANSAAVNAVNAAGLQAFGDFYDLGMVFCGDADIDWDIIFLGSGAATLSFDRIMIVDDGAELIDGAEIARVRSLFPFPCPPTALTNTPGLINEVGSVGTINPMGELEVLPAPPGDSIFNLLDPTPGTCYSPGVNGAVEVIFDGLYGLITTSGNPVDDFRVDVTNSVPYNIALRPEPTGNADVMQALMDAGFTETVTVPQLVGGETYYVIPGGPFVQDRSFDLDALVPGFLSGELRFDRMLLMDAGTIPTASTCFTMVYANFVSRTTPPPASPNWGNRILDYCPGSFVPTTGDPEVVTGSAGPDPLEALGAPDGVSVALGEGGCITIGRDCDEFANTGDSQPDVIIVASTEPTEFNFGANDFRFFHYRVALDPSDLNTELAMISFGVTDPEGDGYFDIGVHQGATEIDIDALFPGAPAGTLRFEAIQIFDLPTDVTGFPPGIVPAEEIDAVGFTNVLLHNQGEGPFLTPEGIDTTFFISGVFFTTFGTGVIVDNNTDSIKGFPDEVGLTLGNNGYVRIGHRDSWFTTDGTADRDVFVYELGDDEGYRIQLCPADANTTAALSALYPDTDGDNCYEVPTVFFGNEAIDLDAIVPGFQSGELVFQLIVIEDDGMGPGPMGTGNTGVDLDAVALLHKLRPGNVSTDELRLSYRQGGAGPFIDLPSTFFVSTLEPIEVRFEAPTGTYGNRAMIVLLQLRDQGNPVGPPLGFPGFWVNPLEAVTPSPFGAPGIGPGGITLSFEVPPGRCGNCYMFQMITANLFAPPILATSNTLEMCVR